MRYVFFYILTLLLLISSLTLYSQKVLTSKEDSVFQVNGEIYFKFHLNKTDNLDSITKIISIDNVKEGEVYAYANREEFNRFLNFRMDYIILPSPGSLLTEQELNMGNWQKDNMDNTIWNFYPTYSQYLTFMSGFASSFPTICKLDTIGTTAQGRLLLAVKISDSVNYDRSVPQFFYTSSIHGDEITGYVMMLHLIDTLLNSYGTSTRITNLIHNTQIFINPLANPDGTYHSGNNSVSGATRSNANSIDLNRNYPDPADGQHPDGNMWQPETMAFMDYANCHHFTLSMNFHCGIEVVNYPWDTWSRLTADDSWWQFVSKEYADTCHLYGPSGYFDDLNNGITNGYAWYRITGGRQDYHNYFMHCREATLEISSVNNPAGNQLPNYWKYNVHSFLNYMGQAGYGIKGKVYDSITYDPIRAKVFIAGHDVDSSFIYSSLPSGWYFKLIDAGSWSLTFSSPGYYSRTITGVSAARRSVNQLNVKLRPINIYWPRSFFATAVNPYQIDIFWEKNGQNDPVMIAYNTSATFGTPITGTSYTPGMVLAGGGTILYNGTDTSFSHTGLNPNTTHYYQAWSVMTGNSYSTPAAANVTTPCGVYNTFPIIENFTTASVQLPNCWSQEAAGTNAVYSWIRANSAKAGATAWEMKLPRQGTVTSGTLRLKTMFFNTTSVTSLVLGFKHFLDDRKTGATLKIQSSSDGVNWTDEGWSMATSNNTNKGPFTVSLNITHNLNSPATMIAFAVTGNLGSYDNWYIDDVSLKAPGYWVGGTLASLTDWNTASNWGDGLVPVATTNVYIPLRTNLPIVFNDPASPAQCNDLVVSKDAFVTVNPGKVLIINGNITLQTP
jgi:hypothetical protein